MVRFVVRRLLQMVIVFFGTTLVVYAMMFGAQGDPIRTGRGEAGQRGAAGLPDRALPSRPRLLVPVRGLRGRAAARRPRRHVDAAADLVGAGRRVAVHAEAG